MADYFETLQSALADRYILEREVGRGGMATVYLANDLKHQRPVAVKVLRPDLSATLGADRFLREIRIAAGLNHPHIVPLLDSGQREGILFYVMPFVDGESLRDVLLRHRQSDLNDVIRLAREIAGAVTYAHRRGVLHRDIKPENILLSEGHAVVADFGIARAISTAGDAGLTRTGFPLGTPGYMSPEQAAGSTEMDEGTDVFSLATVVYEMITGETPGFWPTEEAVRLGRFIDAPGPHRACLDRAPVAVEQALTRAMAMRSADRFATPMAFVDALTEPSAHKRYRDQDVSDIVLRAAQADGAPTHDDEALSLGGIERIGAEVGIPPARIREAANALEPSSAPRRAAAPAQPYKVDLERVVGGEVPESELGTILEDIQGAMGEVGRVNNSFGRSLSWNSLSFQNSLEGSGRLVHVIVAPKGGKTRIRVTESAGMHNMVIGGTILVSGLLGAGVAGELGMSLVPGVTAVAAAAGGSFLACRAIYRRFVDRRRRILGSLVDTIASHVEATATRELDRIPSGDPG